MAKKIRHKKKPADVKERTPASDPKTIPEEESEKPGNFGGLPDRNLKKNLGC